MQASSKTSIWLFLIAFALVFYGMGASFVESFVNYPTWRLIGTNEFRAYHQALGPLVIGYMVIPLIITTILTMLLVWFRPAPVPRWAIWLAVVLSDNAGLTVPDIECHFDESDVLFKDVTEDKIIKVNAILKFTGTGVEIKPCKFVPF